MSGEYVGAIVGHAGNDSIIKVEANRIVRDAEGQIIGRPTISRSEKQEIRD